MRKINVAIVGLGSRGYVNLETILRIDGVNVVGISDAYKDRIEKATLAICEAGGERPFSSTDYRDVISKADVEAVMIFSSWQSHIRIAIDAMKAGKAVGMEVGGAYSIDECFELVKAWEETRVPFMFLENCCYGKNEMLIKNMVDDGLFGEIVHCHGAYAHDLRREIATGKECRHYRLNEYLNRNCENYPTHDLGPIAKILGINNGNRMIRLVSMASKAAGLEQYINDRKDTIANKELIGQKFSQGDIVTTLITCSGGQTISLKLDTTLPRSYSREFTVRGTKGMYEENTNSVFLDGDKEAFNAAEHYLENFNSAKKFEEKYLPDIWKNITNEIIESGHGGMDYFVFSDFFERLREDLPMPIDVYDAASWMCISCLSEESIAKGNVPVEIPDFTVNRQE